MESIYLFLLGIIAGLFTTAAFTYYGNNNQNQDRIRVFLLCSAPLFIGMMFAYIVINAQKDIIAEQKLKIVELNEKIVSFSSEINQLTIRNKDLHEKVVRFTEIKNLQEIVFKKDELLSTQGPAIQRRKPTSDNAFYIAFNSCHKPGSDGFIHGANFQLHFPILGKDVKKPNCDNFEQKENGETQCSINVTRFYISRLILGDYTYSFSIPDNIDQAGNSIPIQITKEINIERFLGQ